MISMFPDGCTEKAHMCVSVAGHMTHFHPMRFQYSSWWYNNMSYSHGELTPSIDSAILNGHLWQTSSSWLTHCNSWEMCKIKIILTIKFHKKAKTQQQRYGCSKNLLCLLESFLLLNTTQTQHTNDKETTTRPCVKHITRNTRKSLSSNDLYWRKSRLSLSTGPAADNWPGWRVSIFWD